MGFGGFGKIYKIKMQNGDIWAIKKMQFKKEDLENYQKLPEVQILPKLDH